MERIKKLIKKIQNIRIKKVHLDYIAGILSIPVLITAVVINYTNLSSRNNKTLAPTSAPSASKVIVVTQPGSSSPTIATPAACIKSVGPIEITYPSENQNVSNNPLCITINYPNTSYCPVIWSYRINNGAWSDLGSTVPCLYNLPSGSVQFTLRVDSTVSTDTTTLVRNFTYSGSNNIPTPTLTPIPSVSLTPTSIPTQPVSTSSAK